MLFSHTLGSIQLTVIQACSITYPRNDCPESDGPVPGLGYYLDHSVKTVQVLIILSRGSGEVAKYWQ